MNLIKTCSTLILLPLLFSCGGGSNSNEEPTTPATTPIETTILGFHKLKSTDVQTSRYLLLTDSNSYVWDVATQAPALKELMCKSSEILSSFSETVASQSINFICTGGESENLNLVISLNQDTLSYEFNQPYWVGSTLTAQFNINASLASIVSLNGSKISEKNGDFTTEVRDDLDISRYIVASPRGANSFSLMVWSRDWPIGGHCNMAVTYSKNPPLFDDYSNHQYLLLTNRSANLQPDFDCNRQTDVLPMPLQSPLDSYFYGLEDGSFIGVVEYPDFRTIGQLTATN